MTLPPVAREEEHGVDDKGEGVTVQFAAASTLSVHDVAPDTVYPELHVGWHVEPLGRVSVQLPTAASHALSLRTHAAGGPSEDTCELAMEPPAFVNATHSACKWLLL